MRRYPAGSEPAFCYAVEHTLEAEGFFSAHSWDPGGATKYGVTRATAERYGYDVETLTVQDAIRIYWLGYWRRPGFESIDSWHVALELFDTEVNTGRSAVIAQRALVRNRFCTEQEVGGIDGAWGPRTRAAINNTAARYERNYLGALNGEQYAYYHDIRNESLKANALRGWMKRVWPTLPRIDYPLWEAAAETGARAA